MMFPGSVLVRFAAASVLLLCVNCETEVAAEQPVHHPAYDLPQYPAHAVSVDRALHVRSLPPVEGFQSNLYEIYMEPYAYGIRPQFATAMLQADSGDADEAAAAVKGELVFTQHQPPNGPISIRGNITGLTPGKHGLHIHEFGDLRKGCASVGGHFNPFQLQHGGPQGPHRHLGDLGNIDANDEGVAEVNILEHLLSLYGGAPRAIIGRSIVVHAKEDDYGTAGSVDSITSGSSGARLACGIIGVIN